jgi:L-amino acid N-acyltransferase YncA
MSGAPDEVVIRRAKPADAAQIARVHVDSWREAYVGVVADSYLARLDVGAWTERRHSELSRPDRGTSVWVAQEAEQILGFASLGPSRDEDADRTTFELYSVYLEPSAWGRGTARVLVRTVLSTVPAGASVTLWVLDANQRAQRFYRRNGFVSDGVERLEEIGGEYHRALRLRRP